MDAGVTERHVERERSLYTDVYGIDPESPEEDVQMLFDIAIQNRAWSLSPSEYRALSEDFDPGEFLSCNSRKEAFNNIRDNERMREVWCGDGKIHLGSGTLLSVVRVRGGQGRERSDECA